MGNDRRRSASVWSTFLSALLLAGSYSAAVAGERYSSAFGFSMELPDNWLAITAKELENNPQLAEEIASNMPADESLKKQFKKKVKSGNVEYYFDRDVEGYGSASGFADNINVTTNFGSVPSSESRIQKVCQQLRKKYRQGFDPPREVKECRSANVAGKNAIYAEAEGATPLGGDAVALQYFFAKSSSVMIVVTGTFAKKRLEAQRRTFERVVDSIRMQ